MTKRARGGSAASARRARRGKNKRAAARALSKRCQGVSSCGEGGKPVEEHGTDELGFHDCVPAPVGGTVAAGEVAIHDALAAGDGSHQGGDDLGEDGQHPMVQRGSDEPPLKCYDKAGGQRRRNTGQILQGKCCNIQGEPVGNVTQSFAPSKLQGKVGRAHGRLCGLFSAARRCGCPLWNSASGDYHRHGDLGNQFDARGKIDGPTLNDGDVQRRDIDVGLDDAGDQMNSVTVAGQPSVLDRADEFDDDDDPDMPLLVSPSDSEDWTSYRDEAEDEDQNLDDVNLPQALGAAIRGLAAHIALRPMGPGGGEVSKPGSSATDCYATDEYDADHEAGTRSKGKRRASAARRVRHNGTGTTGTRPSACDMAERASRHHGQFGHRRIGEASNPGPYGVRSAAEAGGDDARLQLDYPEPHKPGFRHILTPGYPEGGGDQVSRESDEEFRLCVETSNTTGWAALKKTPSPIARPHPVGPGNPTRT